MKAFTDVPVYIEGEGIKRCNVLFDERIKCIGGSAEGAEIVSLPEDALVLPGFIDEHIHGAGGADAMDGTPAALKTVAQTVAAEGTTGFLATTMTQSPENILKAMRAVKEYRESDERRARGCWGFTLKGRSFRRSLRARSPSNTWRNPKNRCSIATTRQAETP